MTSYSFVSHSLHQFHFLNYIISIFCSYEQKRRQNYGIGNNSACIPKLFLRQNSRRQEVRLAFNGTLKSERGENIDKEGRERNLRASVSKVRSCSSCLCIRVSQCTFNPLLIESCINSEKKEIQQDSAMYFLLYFYALKCNGRRYSETCFSSTWII